MKSIYYILYFVRETVDGKDANDVVCEADGRNEPFNKLTSRNVLEIKVEIRWGCSTETCVSKNGIFFSLRF